MLSRRKRRKNMVFKTNHIFKGRSIEDFRFTDHFLDRWNERIDGPKIISKESLKSYIRDNFNYSEVEHLFGDIYLVGGIYVTAKLQSNGIVFLNTLGTYDENPVLYNIITSGDYDLVMNDYGKMDLSYAG